MAKDKQGPKTINEYHAAFSGLVLARLEWIRDIITDIVPEATECINYGIPTFKLNGNMVHYAGYKNHVGFYPGADGIAAFESEFEGLKYAKGSVQFPNDKPLPLDLIQRMVEYRAEQQRAKGK